MERKNTPLIWETGLDWLGTQLRHVRIPAAVSLIVGLLCHMFMLTNKLPNHDEAYSMFIKGGTWGLGRWGLEVLEPLFPDYSMPWIYGVLAILFITVATCIIVKLFHIQNRLVQGLLAGTMIAFPSLTSTLAYMFTVAPYALAFLLAVIAVCLWERGGTPRCLLAVGFMIASLSVYQSYIAVAAGLLVLLLIQDLLEGDAVPSVVCRGVGYLVFLIASLGIYYGLTMVLNRLRGISFSGYATGNLSFSFSAIPSDILVAYQNFFRFFTTGLNGLMPSRFSRIVHVGMLLCVLALLLPWCWKQRRAAPGAAVLLPVLLGLLPLAVNCMYLFTVPDAVHTLVLYGFIAVYVLAAIAAERFLPEAGRVWKSVSLHLITLAMALITAGNIYLANEISLNLFLRYENAYSFYTALTARLQADPQCTEDTQVAVIGHWQSMDFYRENFSFTDSVTGTTGFLPSNYSKGRFVETYLGLHLPLVSDEEAERIRQTPEFAEMACYPDFGSSRMIEGVLVVKLSD